MPVLIGVSYRYDTLTDNQKIVHKLVEAGLDIVADLREDKTIYEAIFTDGEEVNNLVVQNMLQKGALTIKKRISYASYSKIFSNKYK